MANWTIRNVKANMEGLKKAFNVSSIFATVLANRDILTRRKLETYLYADESLFYTALEMKDMEVAFKKIINSISKKELICIYGDYDVDGVTSTVILYKGLKKFGINTMYYIPDREDEGYGLNIKAIDYIKNAGASIILTCDNGIASIEEVDYINENGMEAIIIDHHEPVFFEEKDIKIEIIPNAKAIVNPKQQTCKYKFKMLSAGGISYKFIEAFYKYMEVDEDIREYLVFASISTVCDIVDLIDENRIIVKKGLEILNKNKDINKGLLSLLKLNNIYQKKITEIDYGFLIGPCINASGRLEKAISAVELFITEDEEKIKKLSEKIVQFNIERKELTAKAYSDIILCIENSEYKNDNVLVIYNDEIHESIAGIVAGRVKEKYYKPTIILTNAKNGAKGSGRSVPAYDIFSEMSKCKHMFEKFGGHKMAAGLSIKKENIDLFRKTLNKNCKLEEKDMVENIVIDKELEFVDINIELARELQKMSPMGKENREAIFATKNVAIEKIFFMGQDKKFIKMLFLKNGIALYGITFNLYDKFIKILEKNNFSYEKIEKIKTGIQKNIDLKLDVVYSIEVNIFNGIENVILKLKDFRLS